VRWTNRVYQPSHGFFPSYQLGIFSSRWPSQGPYTIGFPKRVRTWASTLLAKNKGKAWKDGHRFGRIEHDSESEICSGREGPWTRWLRVRLPLRRDIATDH
jgi:hypothetical protein